MYQISFKVRKNRHIFFPCYDKTPLFRTTFHPNSGIVSLFCSRVPLITCSFDGAGRPRLVLLISTEIFSSPLPPLSPPTRPSLVFVRHWPSLPPSRSAAVEMTICHRGDGGGNTLRVMTRTATGLAPPPDRSGSNSGGGPGPEPEPGSVTMT